MVGPNFGLASADDTVLKLSGTIGVSRHGPAVAWSATMLGAVPAERGRGYKGCLPFAWANRSIHGLGIIYGKENSGLVNVVLESRLYKSSYRKNGREGLKPVSNMALKKWNTNFRLEYSVPKTGLPFQMFRCCRKFTAGTTQWLVSHLLSNQIFRKLL